MKTVRVTIKGASPLLMHRFGGEDAIKTAETKQKNLKKMQDNVTSYLYTDEKGHLVQPATHLIGALKRAGAKFQIVGQGKKTYKNLLGSGAVLISPDMIRHIIQRWDVDRRAVVIESKRIIRERPILPEWALDFEIEYDDEELSANTLREILDHAGKRVGIGDFRPEKGGPYGRFIVTRWEEL